MAAHGGVGVPLPLVALLAAQPRALLPVSRGERRHLWRRLRRPPEGAVTPSEVPIRRLLLERADVGAEFDSWKRAQSTGNCPEFSVVVARTPHRALGPRSRQSIGEKTCWK